MRRKLKNVEQCFAQRTSLSRESFRMVMKKNNPTLIYTFYKIKKKEKYREKLTAPSFLLVPRLGSI